MDNVCRLTNRVGNVCRLYLEGCVIFVRWFWIRVGMSDCELLINVVAVARYDGGIQHSGL